jgi:hypothetical protein
MVERKQRITCEMRREPNITKEIDYEKEFYH